MKNPFEKIKKARYSIKFVFCIMCFLFPLLSVFLSGSLLDRTKFERIADEYSNIISNGYVNGEYVSVIVESNSNSLPSPYQEFLNTYGAFNETNICFAGTVNADKTNRITIKEIDTSDNLSILYADVFSNVAYKNHYKHEYYPLELMFRGNHNTFDSFSFCYISESQANRLLDEKGLAHILENYETLVTNRITITIDGHDYFYTIGNIYLETNYFFQGLKDTMGNFIVCNSKQPQGIALKKQANYYLRQRSYQNEFFMDRINQLYKEKFEIKINTYNFKTPLNNYEMDYLLSFFNGYKNNVLNTTGVILIVFSAILFYCSLILFVFFDIIKNPYVALSLLVGTFIPYLIFMAIKSMTKNILFFSSVSTTIFGVLVLSFISFAIVFLIKSSRLSFKKRKTND